MRNHLLTVLLIAALAAGACAGSDTAGYAGHKVLDQVHVDEAVSVFAMAVGGRLLVYVAQIDYQTGWPIDRLYVIDPHDATVQSETGLVYAAVNETRRYLALNRIGAEEDWPESIDTVVWPGVNYEDFEYWLDDGGEEIAIPYMTVYDLKTMQAARTWFPAGGYTLWATDETLVLCMASWGTLNEEGFTAEQAWFRSSAPEFAEALRSVPPVPDTAWFERYPVEPWVEAEPGVEWKSGRGVFTTREAAATDEASEYWSKASVVRIQDSDTSVVTAGRVLAVSPEGDDLVVQAVRGDTLEIVWLRYGESR